MSGAQAGGSHRAGRLGAAVAVATATRALGSGRSSSEYARMPAAETLSVLHLTDLHLRIGTDDLLYGVRTEATFRATLARALADPAWQPAVVLATGDLAEDPSPAVYRRFRAALEPLGLPVLCLPGNHDDPAVMRRELGDGLFSYCGAASFGRWRIVMLDSVVPGQPGGALAPGELARLDAELAAAGDAWVLVAVHHQALPMGSAWLDGFGLADGATLLGRLARHPRARAVAWGHVHQASDRQVGSLRLLSTPSTCAQFTPGTERCVMDTRPPAFRRLDLGADGSIATEVHWLEDWAPATRPPDFYGRP
jgi:Icc protein